MLVIYRKPNSEQGKICLIKINFGRNYAFEIFREDVMRNSTLKLAFRKYCKHQELPVSNWNIVPILCLRFPAAYWNFESSVV